MKQQEKQDEDKRLLSLQVLSPTSFAIHWDKHTKCMVLWWEAPTEVKNLIWVRVVTLGVRPFIKKVEYFTDPDEEYEGRG